MFKFQLHVAVEITYICLYLNSDLRNTCHKIVSQAFYKGTEI